MKSVGAILLLLIFSFNLIGNYVLFTYQKASIRREIIQRIESGIQDDDIATITITREHADQLIWKDDNEFLFHNNLYDIVHLETHHNKTVYYCLKDDKEGNLYVNYAKKIHKNKRSKRQVSTKLVKCLNRTELHSLDSRTLAFHKQSQQQFLYIDHYNTRAQEILSPPPKLVL